MGSLYLVGIVALSLLAVAGALHPSFNDTFTQRAGLSLTGLGGVAEAAALVTSAAGSPNAHTLLVLGCAIYGVGTGLKTWHYRTKQ